MDIERLVRRQRAFFKTGRTGSYEFRMHMLHRLEKEFRAAEMRLNEALARDLHKSQSESYMTETGMTLSELHYVMKHLKAWMRPERVRTPIAQFYSTSLTIPEPYGVVLVMAPWNYPVLLCLEPLIDAVAAGNCVVLKPSAYAPAVSALLKQICEAAFPPGLVTVVEGGRAENEELLAQRFDYIFFTGSISVGRLVLEKASRHLTPVTLELGGKSPCIVDETANLRIAARRIVFGKLLNAGQTCVAPDYIIVQKSVKEKLIHYMQQEIRNMLGEDPLSSEDYPRIINNRHYRRLMGLIQQEKVVTGGYGNEETQQIAPTILRDVSKDSAVMREEIFGPVLPVLAYGTWKELEEIIDSYEKPLAFYLFTGNRSRERRAIRRFSFGGGCINDTIVHLATSRMGFGGVGYSGMGAYHGKTGFETFSHRKSIVRKSVWPDLPFRYQPYSAKKDRLIRLFLK